MYPIESNYNREIIILNPIIHDNKRTIQFHVFVEWKLIGFELEIRNLKKFEKRSSKA